MTWFNSRRGQLPLALSVRLRRLVPRAGRSSVSSFSASPALNFIAAFLFAGLLGTACAHRDVRDPMFRQQIVGTWSQGDWAETCLLPNGSFHSDLKYADRNVRIDGTWEVKAGDLVILKKHLSESFKPGVTNIASGSGSPNRTFHKIIALDSACLTVLTEDPQTGVSTNSWERK